MTLQLPQRVRLNASGNLVLPGRRAEALNLTQFQFPVLVRPSGCEPKVVTATVAGDMVSFLGAFATEAVRSDDGHTVLVDKFIP